MSTWRQTTLGMLLELQRGHDLTERQRTHGPVPVIGSAGQNGWHNVARSKGPGVTIGRSGASAGVVTYVHSDYWPHNTALYVKDFKGNHPLFIAYLLRTLPLAELNSGAAQPSLNRNFLYPLPVNAPGPIEQQRIAEILGAYDDLIEVNRRRVALLEEMGRSLFEEWFVRLRFPDAGDAQTGDDIGLPDGWRKPTIGETADVSMGGTWGEDCPDAKSAVRAWVLRGTDFPSLRSGGPIKVPERFVSQSALDKRALRERDIVIEGSGGSKDQPVGRALYVSQAVLDRFDAEVVPASFCKLLRVGAQQSPEITYWHLDAMYRNGKIERYQTQSTGLRNLQFTVMLNQEQVVSPDGAVRSAFERAVRPIMSALGNYALQNSRLSASRNLLLPRLISGQLSLADAERELAHAA